MSKELISLEDMRRGREHINTFELQLPHQVGWRVGMDIERTKKLMQIGGLRYLGIKSDLVDENPGYAAFNCPPPSNTLLAVPKMQDFPNIDGKKELYLTVGIKTRVIEQQLIEAGEAQSYEKWAQILNDELVDAIRKACAPYIQPIRLGFLGRQTHKTYETPIIKERKPYGVD